MKKTLTVNLSGTVYHIDEDAYRLLDNYLSNLKLYFRKQQGAEEIVIDFEARIAELFMEKVNGGKQVITIADVEEVIARMGKPEDFEAVGDETETSNSGHTGSYNQPHSKTSTAHRLYRNPDDRLLGGVASGLAAYFGWDTALVRVLMILLVFVPVCPMIILYIIGWIVIPEAHTAAEKLSMRGEAVTIENIGKTVTDGFERVSSGVNDYVNSDKPRTQMQKVLDVLVSVAAFLFKLFLVILIIAFCPALFVIVVLFVVLVIIIIAAAISGGDLLYNMLPSVDWAPLITVSPIMTVAGTLAGLALIGIPLAGFVYAMIRRVFHWAPMGTTLKWALLIIWLLGLIVFFINLSALEWQLPLYGIHSI